MHNGASSLVLAVGMVVGLLAGLLIERTSIQRAAIEAGCAAYDPVTGDWEWIKVEDDNDEP